MYELIFYSIPGFLFVGAVVLWYQLPLDDLKAILAAVSTPLLGYILHNIYRFLFELSGNYSRKSRKVIDYIINKYSNANVKLDRNQAFLIWEHSIYHKSTSIPFLEHDGRMWRFIQSFWSVTLVASLLVCYFLWDTYFSRRDLTGWQIMMLLALFAISFVFYARGRIILASLNDQEIAFVKVYEQDLFANVAEKLIFDRKKKRNKKGKRKAAAKD